MTAQHDHSEFEEALRECESKVRAIFDHTYQFIGLLTPDGVLIDANRTSLESLAIGPNETLGKPFWETPWWSHSPALQKKLRAAIRRAATGKFVRFEATHPNIRGELRHIDFSLKPVKAENGNVIYLIPEGRDVTERKKAEEKLKSYRDQLELLVKERTDELVTANQRLRHELHVRRLNEKEIKKLSQAIEQSPMSVVITNFDDIIEYVNPRFTEITGYTKLETIGKSPSLIDSGYAALDTAAERLKAINEGRGWRGELLHKKKDGTLFWEYVSSSPIMDEKGAITHYVEVKEDITLRKEYEQRLLHQANYDNLTNLPNRVLALDRLSRALIGAKRDNSHVILAFIDMDNFKNINDTLGHEIGDRLLVDVAGRLTESVREDDTVARFGGDEFLLVMRSNNPLYHSDYVISKLRSNFSLPYLINTHEIFVSVSIGLTIFPNDGSDPQVLLRNADSAMYQAKNMGKGTYQFFTPEMDKKARRRLELDTYLHHALEKDELLLHYQPISDASTERLTGCEALIRWDNPSLGLMYPDQFIRIAEESGMIVPIGEWVLHMACQQARQWQLKTGLPLNIAVNVSSRQFRGKGLVKAVAHALADSSLPARCLELEITENLVLSDTPDTGKVIRELSEMGVRLSIDDFGTGYSAFNYLRKYPFNTLKLDQSFVQGIPHNRDDEALSKAIISMAHSLGLKVVGEGIENEAQFRFLRAGGCDMMQGFYLSRPVSSAAFSSAYNI